MHDLIPYSLRCKLWFGFSYSDDLVIVGANETWLSENVYNAEILHSGYCIVRKDRKTRGGGVMLGIKTSVFKQVREIKHNHDLEIAMAEITTVKDMKMLICSCYRPPNSDKTWCAKFETFLQDVRARHSKIVIAGDFNFPHANWKYSRENVIDTKEDSFNKLLNDFFLEQLNSTPTRGENILDLLITNVPDQVKICEYLKPSYSGISTDHNAIIFDLFISCNPFPKIKDQYLITDVPTLMVYECIYNPLTLVNLYQRTTILTKIGSCGKIRFGLPYQNLCRQKHYEVETISLG